jgi:hypothetical protein
MNQTPNSAVIGSKQKRIAPKTTTASLGPTDNYVETDSTGGAFTVTMPFSYECPQGSLYMIRHIVDGGDVTIAYRTGDRGPASQIITAAGGYVALIANPGQWSVAAAVLS